MRPASKALTIILASFWLSACHTDPFSIKPETNATLPQNETPLRGVDDDADALLKDISKTERIEEHLEKAVPSQALLIDHTSDAPIPRTTKLVRGIQHQSVIKLGLGESVTLAVNTNRASGYVWVLEGPFGIEDGVEFTADYYREGESVFPGRTSIGGARFFVLTARSLGRYEFDIHHAGTNDVRATKRVTLEIIE